MSVLLGQVLEESGFAESRASKMDVDDFLRSAFPKYHSLASADALLRLRLLTVFHKHGLHFA